MRRRCGVLVIALSTQVGMVNASGRGDWWEDAVVYMSDIDAARRKADQEEQSTKRVRVDVVPDMEDAARRAMPDSSSEVPTTPRTAAMTSALNAFSLQRQNSGSPAKNSQLATLMKGMEAALASEVVRAAMAAEVTRKPEKYQVLAAVLVSSNSDSSEGSPRPRSNSSPEMYRRGSSVERTRYVSCSKDEQATEGLKLEDLVDAAGRSADRSRVSVV